MTMMTGEGYKDKRWHLTTHIVCEDHEWQGQRWLYDGPRYLNPTDVVSSVYSKCTYLHHRIIDDRKEKYDAYASRRRFLKVGLPQWRMSNSRRERGRGAGPVLPWHTLRPPPFPTSGYICGLWVLRGQYNSQSNRANADCADFVVPLHSFLFCHL